MSISCAKRKESCVGSSSKGHKHKKNKQLVRKNALSFGDSSWCLMGSASFADCLGCQDTIHEKTRFTHQKKVTFQGQAHLKESPKYWHTIFTPVPIFVCQTKLSKRRIAKKNNIKRTSPEIQLTTLHGLAKANFQASSAGFLLPGQKPAIWWHERKRKVMFLFWLPFSMLRASMAL